MNSSKEKESLSNRFCSENGLAHSCEYALRLVGLTRADVIELSSEYIRKDRDEKATV